jgi:hypothetical protein
VVDKNDAMAVRSCGLEKFKLMENCYIDMTDDPDFVIRNGIVARRWLTREKRRAADHSKRHHCEVIVQVVIGGYGKGRMQFDRVEDGGGNWWPTSKVAVVAKYMNGRLVKNDKKDKE